MCTGRVDPAFVLRAFRKGADGVIVGGCWPGECHYVTEGNYDALANMHLCRKLLDHIGLKSDRLRLEWISASEGTRFAEVMSDFAGQLRELGPLGKGEGVDDDDLKLNLDAVDKLLPYLKLVEREKLRIPTKTVEAYEQFYKSDEFNELFTDLISEKLAIRRMLLLLGQGPLSSEKISQRLDLSPSAVARYINSSSSEGLVRFDQACGSYALV